MADPSAPTLDEDMLISPLNETAPGRIVEDAETKFVVRVEVVVIITVKSESRAAFTVLVTSELCSVQE